MWFLAGVAGVGFTFFISFLLDCYMELMRVNS